MKIFCFQNSCFNKLLIHKHWALILAHNTALVQVPLLDVEKTCSQAHLVVYCFSDLIPQPSLTQRAALSNQVLFSY